MGTQSREEPYWNKIILIAVFVSLAMIVLCGPTAIVAGEKGYPSQPIKIVVPNAPGGSNDLLARMVADYLAKELKVPVLVENREGASGMLGAAMVFKAKPDGYTLLAGGDLMCAGVLQSPNPPFNPFTDFLPICMVGATPSAFGVYSSSPFKTLTEFVKAAKGSPGKLTCGVTTLGSSTHLGLILLIKYSEIDIKVIPYKGNPQAIPALLGKHIDMLTLTSPSFRPQAESGEARILAVSSPIPGTSLRTLMEEGFPQPEFRLVEGFTAYHVVRNTPKEIHDKLVLTFERMVKNPEFSAKLDGLGSIRSYKNPAEYKEFIRDKWRVTSDILETLGLRRWQGTVDWDK